MTRARHFRQLQLSGHPGAGGTGTYDQNLLNHASLDRSPVRAAWEVAVAAGTYDQAVGSAVALAGVVVELVDHDEVRQVDDSDRPACQVRDPCSRAVRRSTHGDGHGAHVESTLDGHRCSVHHDQLAVGRPGALASRRAHLAVIGEPHVGNEDSPIRGDPDS